MKPDELRAELKRLGLTQPQAGALLDVDERTVRRWCSGDRDIPKAVAMLLERLSPDEVKP